MSYRAKSTPGVGPLEAAFIVKLNSIFDSLKKQVSENANALYNDYLNKIVGEILVEQYNVLVAMIRKADSPSGFTVGGYTYPDLDLSYIVEKQLKYPKYKNQEAAFKNQRFAQNRRASLVGVMQALGRSQNAATLLSNAFGQYGDAITTDTGKTGSYLDMIKDPKEREAYRKNAERKLEELSRKRKFI